MDGQKDEYMYGKEMDGKEMDEQIVRWMDRKINISIDEIKDKLMKLLKKELVLLWMDRQIDVWNARLMEGQIN